MEAQKKHRLKKNYKFLIWMSISCIGLSITGFVSIVSNNFPVVIRIIMVLLVVTFLILSLISNVGADFIKRDLLKYREDIKTFRARRAFHKIIDLVLEGNLDQAISLYQANIPENTYMRSYLYGILITELLHTPNKEKQGMTALEGLKKSYDPNEITL